MKKYFYLVIALMMVSCTDQFMVEDVAGEYAQQTPASEVAALMEKARWGDGQAYVKLADCYREGKGVKQDFITMLGMVSFADDYGGIGRMEDYLSALPEDSEYKLVVDVMEKFSAQKQDEGLAMAEKLIEQDCPEGYTVKGIILSGQGNHEEGNRLLEYAAGQGSGLAELYLCAPDWHNGQNPDIAKLKALADRMPIANTWLGKIFTGKDDESQKNEQLAAYYYMRADENACLGRDGARWLLGYYRAGGHLELSEKDVERLEILAGESTKESEVSQHNDPSLEAAITDYLHGYFDDYLSQSKAMIYVVETKTGKIKANVSLERIGDTFIPYTDTYDQELSTMETGSTYLALLSSGRVTPEHVFDTGSGVYEDMNGNLVRDHNWRRGGYQQICLEQALEVRSQIAFTMAKERVYGDNMSEFEEQVNSYLAWEPNSPMGLLTFYNAIANNGKMVKLVSEGEDGVVLQEQIAEPQYVGQLQKGLEQCVSQGLMRKAGRDFVKVSACGRTFVTEGNHRRMELFGYFPSDNPLYTIMVVLEKDGLPASSGGMCGPIFAHIVDVLVDLYSLQPLLVRKYEDMDEVTEIVDTVAVAN